MNMRIIIMLEELSVRFNLIDLRESVVHMHFLVYSLGITFSRQRLAVVEVWDMDHI